MTNSDLNREPLDKEPVDPTKDELAAALTEYQAAKARYDAATSAYVASRCFELMSEERISRSFAMPSAGAIYSPGGSVTIQRKCIRIKGHEGPHATNGYAPALVSAT